MKYYLSIESISKKYDVPRQTIMGWIKRYGDLEVIKVFGSIKIEKNSLNNHIKPRKSGNEVYKNEKRIFGIIKEKTDKNKAKSKMSVNL